MKHNVRVSIVLDLVYDASPEATSRLRPRPTLEDWVTELAEGDMVLLRNRIEREIFNNDEDRIFVHVKYLGERDIP